MPSEKLTCQVSPQWKELGFQGSDPATDFRGMGLFGLMCLQYPSMQLLDMDIEYSINMREKTLAIGHQFAKLANVFSCQHSPLYGNHH